MTEFSTTYQPDYETKTQAVVEGTKRHKAIRDALNLALAREIEIDGKMTRKLVVMADALVNRAMIGDVQAFNAIADRTEGKVPQPTGGSDELPPNKMIIEWKPTIPSGS